MGCANSARHVKEKSHFQLKPLLVESPEERQVPSIKEKPPKELEVRVLTEIKNDAKHDDC